MKDALVSVVIPVGPDAEWLDECLSAVARQDFPKKEVIVVCDARAAQLASLPAGSEDLRVLKESRPCAPADLINAGMRAARGHVKVLLMPWCIPVGTGWMSAMAAPFGDDAVGVVVSQCLQDPTSHRAVAARLLDAVDPPQRRSADPGLVPQEMVSHLCDAYRASLLADMGYFESDGLVPRAQAIDASVKVADAGYSIILSDAAAVTYHVPRSRQSLTAAMRQAPDYGRADALLSKLHDIHWLNSGVLAASFFAPFLLPAATVNLPVTVIFSALIFAWSAFLSVRFPIIHWECPLAIVNFAAYVAIIVLVRSDWWPDLFGKDMHPAVIRQWCWLIAVAGSDLLVLAAASLVGALRTVRRAGDVPYAVPVLAFGLVWWLLAGLGHMAGPVFPGARKRVPSEAPG